LGQLTLRIFNMLKISQAGQIAWWSSINRISLLSQTYFQPPALSDFWDSIQQSGVKFAPHLVETRFSRHISSYSEDPILRWKCRISRECTNKCISHSKHHHPRPSYSRQRLRLYLLPRLQLGRLSIESLIRYPSLLNLCRRQNKYIIWLCRHSLSVRFVPQHHHLKLRAS